MHRIILILLLFLPLPACSSGNSGSQGPSLADRKANAMKMTNPDARASQLVKIAKEQFAAGDPTGGRATLKSAQMAVNEIQAESAKAATGLTVARALAENSMDLEAKELLKSVRKAIDADANPATKSSALGQMALIYGTTLENETAAENYLKQAVGLVEGIETPIDRVNALLEVANAYQKINRAESAAPAFDSALASARSAATPREKSDLLISVANRMQQLELAEKAAPVRQEARDIAASIEDDFSRGYALVAVAGSYRQAGDAATADMLSEEAQAAADKVTDQGLKKDLEAAIRGR